MAKKTGIGNGELGMGKASSPDRCCFSRIRLWFGGGDLQIAAILVSMSIMSMASAFGSTALLSDQPSSQGVAIDSRPPSPAGSALRYMDRHAISRACAVLIAYAGNSGKVVVGSSTGDEELDRLLVDGLTWDIKKWKRIRLDDFPRHKGGGRAVKFDLDLGKSVHGRVLGCDVKSARPT